MTVNSTPLALLPHKERLDLQWLILEEFEKKRAFIRCEECKQTGKVTKDAKPPKLRFKCKCKRVSYTWADMGRLLGLDFEYTYCTDPNKSGFSMTLANDTIINDMSTNIIGVSSQNCSRYISADELSDSDILQNAMTIYKAPKENFNDTIDNGNFIDDLSDCEEYKEYWESKNKCQHEININVRVSNIEREIAELKEMMQKIINLQGDFQNSVKNISSRISRMDDSLKSIQASNNSNNNINTFEFTSNLNLPDTSKNNNINYKKIMNNNKENEKNISDNNNMEKTKKKIKKNHNNDNNSTNIKSPGESSDGELSNNEGNYISKIQTFNHLDNKEAKEAIKKITLKRIPIHILKNRNEAIPDGKNLVRIYVRGLNILTNTNTEGLRISELKDELFKLRFQLSRIVNISPAGPLYTEFLIFKEYLPSFKSKCESLNLLFDEDYDPSKPFNPSASEEIKTRIKDRLITRINNTIERTKRIEVKDYFTNWLSKINDFKNITIDNSTIDNNKLNLNEKRYLEEHKTGLSPVKKIIKKIESNVTLEEVGSDIEAVPTSSSQ